MWFIYSPLFFLVRGIFLHNNFMLFWHRWWSLSAKWLFFLNGRIMGYNARARDAPSSNIYNAIPFVYYIAEIRIFLVNNFVTTISEKICLHWFSVCVFRFGRGAKTQTQTPSPFCPPGTPAPAHTNDSIPFVFMREPTSYRYINVICIFGMRVCS